MQSAEMGMDRVPGDPEAPGNGEFGLVIENAAHDLQLATGEVERPRDLGPGWLAKDRRPLRVRPLIILPARRIAESIYDLSSSHNVPF